MESHVRQQPPVRSGPRGLRPQFGLRGMLLATAMVAVWGTHYMNLRMSRHLEAQIGVMRQFKNELRVDDPTRITIVKRPRHWIDDNQWDLFLPSDGYQLCLATEQVEEEDLAPPDSCVALPQGRLRLELLQSPDAQGWKVEVQLDGTEVLSLIKPATWHNGLSSSNSEFDRMKELAPHETLVLFRRRFAATPRAGTVSKEPCTGVLLWIEPTAERRRSVGPKP